MDLYSSTRKTVQSAFFSRDGQVLKSTCQVLECIWSYSYKGVLWANLAFKFLIQKYPSGNSCKRQQNCKATAWSPTACLRCWQNVTAPKLVVSKLLESLASEGYTRSRKPRSLMKIGYAWTQASRRPQESGLVIWEIVLDLKKVVLLSRRLSWKHKWRQQPSLQQKTKRMVKEPLYPNSVLHI